MPEEIPFKNLLQNIVDNRGRTCPVGDEGLPLIATNCIDNSRLYPKYDTSRFVNQETYDNWFRGHPESGDMIFVCKGSPGRVAMAPDPVDFCIAQDMVAIRADPSKVYPHYLFAVIRSSLVQDRITNMHVGSLIPHFKKGDFDKLDIPVPSRGEQAVIGDMYFAISKKIEQSRQTAGKLEELARSVFKAWFIDFEPVHAKANGATTYPGLSQTAFDDLPASFQDSPIGPIPKGWSVKTISEVCHVNQKSVKKNEVDGEIEYIDISAVAKGELADTRHVDFEEAPSRARRRVQHGDTIWSCVRPNRMSYLYIADPADNLIVSTGFAVLSPHNVGSNFLHQLVTRPEFVDYLVANATGSAYPAVKAEHFERATFCCPPDKLLDDFEAAFDPMRCWMTNAAKESRKLAELRDYLLPRLLSGSIRARTGE